MNLYGSDPVVADSTFTLNRGSTITVQGDSSNGTYSYFNLNYKPSTGTFANYFNQIYLLNDITVGTYGQFRMWYASGGIYIGSAANPVTITADGTNSLFAINQSTNYGWTPGDLYYYGNAVASNGGAISLQGKFTYSSGPSVIKYPTNITAVNHSTFNLDHYASIQLGSDMTISSRGGAAGGSSVSFGAAGNVTTYSLGLSSSLNLDGNSAMSFYSSGSININATSLNGVANSLQLTQPGTLNFANVNTGYGQTTMTLAGVNHFGATASGANLNIGTSSTITSILAFNTGTVTDFSATNGGNVSIAGVMSNGSAWTPSSVATLNEGTTIGGVYTPSVLTVGGGSSASLFSITGFQAIKVLSDMNVAKNGELYLKSPVAGGSVNIGSATHPVNITANGDNAKIFINSADKDGGNVPVNAANPNNWLGNGTNNQTIPIYGNIAISNGGLMRLEGNSGLANPANSLSVTGNITADGVGTVLLPIGGGNTALGHSTFLASNFSAVSFGPTQTLTATNGGLIEIRYPNTLTLNSPLVLGAGSTIWFEDVIGSAVVGSQVVGANGDGLKISAGTLMFNGYKPANGVSFASFTAQGASAIGAVAKGAVLDISEFATINGNSGASYWATNGGKATLAGASNSTNTGASTTSVLTLAAGSGVTVYGHSTDTVNGTTTVTPSYMKFSQFYKTSILNNIAVGLNELGTAVGDGQLFFGGSTGGITVGSTTTPVTLSANGPSAMLGLNWDPASNTTGTTGALTFYGNATAINGGTVHIDGTSGTGNTATFTGNLSAIGSGTDVLRNTTVGSSLYYRNWINPNFGPGQVLTATGGGALTVWGANSATDTLTFGAANASLPGAAVVVGDGIGSSTMNFAKVHDVYINTSIGSSAAGALTITPNNSTTSTTTVSNNAVLSANGAASFFTINPAGALTLGGSLVSSAGGVATIDGTGLANANAVLNGFTGNLTSIGLGSQTKLLDYRGVTLGSGQQITASNGGIVTVADVAPNQTGAAASSLNLSSGSTVAAWTGAAGGSTLNFNNYDAVTTSTPVWTDIGSTINFSAIGNSAATIFALTANGNGTDSSHTGNVNVSGRTTGTIGSAPLSLGTTAANGTNLTYSNFDTTTLGAAVSASTGGLNFIGYSGNWGAANWVRATSLSGAGTNGITLRNGSWGQATDLTITGAPIVIDPTSSFDLTYVDLTGGSINIQGNSTSKGVLNIWPRWPDVVNHNQLIVPVRFNQSQGGTNASYVALSGTGMINVHANATLTTTAASDLWDLPAGLTLTGQGTAQQLGTGTGAGMSFTNNGIILSDTAGTLTVQSYSPMTFHNSPTGVVRWQTGGDIFFKAPALGPLDIFDNQGLVENLSTSTTLTSLNQLPNTINSSGAWGTIRANGLGVAIDFNSANATVSNQTVDATNNAIVYLNGRDFTNVNLTSSNGGVLRGGTGAVSFVGTVSQNISPLSTLTNATLTGSSTLLTLVGSEKIAVNTSTPSYVTAGAELLLAGNGGHQVLSSNWNQPAQLVVSNGGSIVGAGNTAAHQVGLAASAGGTIQVLNAGLPTTAPNPAMLPVFSNGTWTTTSPVSGNNVNQTLSVLGDVQMSAGSILNVTIFGSSNNANSLLSAGSAGTAASTLAGNLVVNVAQGITPSGLYVVFQDNGPNPFTGSFSNAPAGAGTLTSADGQWRFGVTYANNQAFLYNATAVPEPSSYALLSGLVGFGYLIWRRRRLTPLNR